MASSSSNQYPYVTVEVGEEEEQYPCPSNLSATNFITVKLCGRDKYFMWKTQMLCLLESHDMIGFIDGTIVNPKTSVYSGKEKKVVDHYRMWRRSDAIVKGWILASLSERTLRYVLNRLMEKLHQQQSNADFTAKDVWDELQSIYGYAILPQRVADKQEKEGEEGEEIVKIHERLAHATVSEDWYVVDDVLRTKLVTVIDKISINGNTALHLAVATNQRRPGFIEKLVGMTPENRAIDVRNSDGSTLLHVAAIVGNIEAAKILVGRNRDLLFAKDNQGHTPVITALSNMHTEMAYYLLQQIDSDIEKDTLFSGASGDELLVGFISCKDFRLAHDLVGRYRTLRSDVVLMAIAQNFPCELYMLGEYTLWTFNKERVRTRNDALGLLWKVCKLIKDSNDPGCHHHYYTKPIIEATKRNAYEVVNLIGAVFPNAIWIANEDGHNVIQHAVISRSERVYNMLYQISEHNNIYKTLKDESGNNLLHLAARLAPANKLNLISGAPLQMQRELQWFKEVEGFVCPRSSMQKNSFGEKPQMVFTREHKDLVIEGEKWMKATAESYTITAALITTIVFAAAITVPGGNNENTGIPIFTGNSAFTIFAISDVVSLFASVTSLIMFLSILTARYAAHDFLFKLPTKLIIGLATLFISTTAMIVAFGATLYLEFGQRSRILIVIAVLTCLPITSFVTLQFPLIIDLIIATYGCSIFGKKSNISFY